MIKVGITGGMGAGKSTVAMIFDTLQIPVYFADDRAKHVMLNDSEVRYKITELLGEDAYTQGNLNRPWIAAEIFGDQWKLSKVNHIVHPAVDRDFKNWCEGFAGKRYVCKEAALIYESGSYLDLDVVIVVKAPKSVRILRIKKRDGLSDSQIRKRLSKQWPEDRRLMLADHVIVNDGSRSLIRQVLGIHKLLQCEDI